MKRFRILICLLGCMILFSACSGKESSSESIVTKDSNTTSDSKEDSSSEPTSTSEEESADEELIFYPEEADANWWYYHDRIIPTSRGFYRMELANDNRLFFYNKEGEKTVVCGKPDCGHNDESCGAYLSGNNVSYWDGRLYYVTRDREMISMLPDGTDRRSERSNIGEYDPEGHNGLSFGDEGYYQHYFICDIIIDKSVREGDEIKTYEEKKTYLYDLLKPEEEPILWTSMVMTNEWVGDQVETRYISGDWADFLGPYENKFYFIQWNGDPFDLETPKTLIAWSLEENQMETLCPIPSEVRRIPDIRGDRMIYQIEGDGVWEVSIYGGEPKKLIDVDLFNRVVHIDEQYIFISVETEYRIYDLDGRLINSLPLTQEMQNWKLILLSKWEDKLLFGTRGRGERRIVYTLDYTKIGTDELEWEAFP